MKFRRLLPIGLLIIGINLVPAQETFKLMFYNVLNYPIQGPNNRLENLEEIINDYHPDLFMICELNNEQGADQILQLMQGINPNYERAAFVLNTSDDTIGNSNELQNMIYYDNSKFNLESQTEVTTIYRDFNHYKLKLKATDQEIDPVILDIFVCHLKSSSGTENKNLRFQMVQAFTSYLESLPNNSNIVLAGDFNMYTSSEPGFQELIDNSNHITLIDPPNRIGSWSNNTNFLDVFTQSTRAQTGLGGAWGGFDDRFDFIMLSENMTDNEDISYVSNSYQVYGNNNNPNCYNQDINSSNCSGALFNDTLLNALYYMSDHLPVTLELQTNKSLTEISVSLEHFGFKGSNVSTSEIILNLGQKTVEAFRIVNTLGQTMNSYILDEEKEFKIDISSYSNGVYYIVPKNKAISPLRFVKN